MTQLIRKIEAIRTEYIENMAAREATLNRTHREETGKLEREREQLANCTHTPEPAATHFWGHIAEAFKQKA